MESVASPTKNLDGETRPPTARIPGTVEIQIKVAIEGTKPQNKLVKIWGVYFPSEGSHQAVAHEERKGFTQNLGKAITTGEEHFHQIVVGDTNAIIGDEEDDKIEADHREEWNKMKREKSPDKYINQNGAEILQIARSNANMFRLNGRTLPDEFIFEQENEKSDAKPRRSNCDTILHKHALMLGRHHSTWIILNTH